MVKPIGNDSDSDYRNSGGDGAKGEEVMVVIIVTIVMLVFLSLPLVALLLVGVSLPTCSVFPR